MDAENVTGSKTDPSSKEMAGSVRNSTDGTTVDTSAAAEAAAGVG